MNPKGKKMKEASRIKFFLNSDGGANTYTALLELKNYKAKDSGTYTCNIKNDAGEANVELTLNIEGKYYVFVLYRYCSFVFFINFLEIFL